MSAQYEVALRSSSASQRGSQGEELGRETCRSAVNAECGSTRVCPKVADRVRSETGEVLCVISGEGGGGPWTQHGATSGPQRGRQDERQGQWQADDASLKIHAMLALASPGCDACVAIWSPTGVGPAHIMPRYRTQHVMHCVHGENVAQMNWSSSHHVTVLDTARDLVVLEPAQRAPPQPPTPRTDAPRCTMPPSEATQTLCACC